MNTALLPLFTPFLLATTIGLALLIVGQMSWNSRVKKRHRLTQSSLHILQRQLNQHFIFNSLNAINYHLLVDNNAQASDLLSKFAKLIRYFLEASEKTTNSVERECRLLTLYLELEQIRFQHFFSFKINYDSETERLPIPSMIVYPIIESAIRSQVQSAGSKFELLITFKLNRGVLTGCVQVEGMSALNDENIADARRRLKLLMPQGKIVFPQPLLLSFGKIRNTVLIRF